MDHIHISWKPLFEKYQFDLDELYCTEHIYPPQEQIFRIFALDVSEIKIVLLGQDPYHSPGLAHGLSFSVPKNVKIPPSLRNIYKELQLEFPERNYEFLHGNLEQWVTREKIFLLNSSLSVVHGKPGSHIKYWERFTNNVIKYISEHNEQCVFILLGNYAKTKALFIQNKLNIILAPHPSPATRGFIGSNVFSNCENILGKTVDWSINSV